MGGHKFPLVEKLRKRWEIAIKRANLLSKGKVWKPGKSACVCRNHFEDNDYVKLNLEGQISQQIVKNKLLMQRYISLIKIT